MKQRSYKKNPSVSGMTLYPNIKKIKSIVWNLAEDRDKIKCRIFYFYKNELLLPYNARFLVKKNSCDNFFSFLSYFSYYHGQTDICI